MKWLSIPTFFTGLTLFGRLTAQRHAGTGITGILKSYVLTMLVLTTLLGCRKDDPAPVQESISGVFEGKYGNGTKTPDFFWGFEIKPGGVINELNSAGEKIGDGIWTKSGDKFLATYHNDTPYNATYSLKAVYSTSEHTLTGTWGFGNNDSDGGTFRLTRK
jgi:hypothetical protein